MTNVVGTHAAQLCSDTCLCLRGRVGAAQPAYLRIAHDRKALRDLEIRRPLRRTVRGGPDSCLKRAFGLARELFFQRLLRTTAPDTTLAEHEQRTPQPRQGLLQGPPCLRKSSEAPVYRRTVPAMGAVVNGSLHARFLKRAPATAVEGSQPRP